MATACIHLVRVVCLVLMELRASDDTRFEIGFGAVVKLPKFMAILDQENAEKVRSAPDKEKRLLAAGLNKGELMMLTATGEFKLIKRFEADLTMCSCEPSPDGTEVWFTSCVPGKSPIDNAVSSASLLKRAIDMGLVIRL